VLLGTRRASPRAGARIIRPESGNLNRQTCPAPFREMLVRNHAISENLSSGSLADLLRLNPLALDCRQLTQGRQGQGEGRSLQLHRSSWGCKVGADRIVGQV